MRAVKMTSVYKAVKVLGAWSEQFNDYPKKGGRLFAIEKKAQDLEKAKGRYYKLVREYLDLRVAAIKRKDSRLKIGKELQE